MDFERYWEMFGELHASMCGGDIKRFAKEIWHSAISANNLAWDGDVWDEYYVDSRRFQPLEPSSETSDPDDETAPRTCTLCGSHKAHPCSFSFGGKQVSADVCAECVEHNREGVLQLLNKIASCNDPS